MALAAGYYGGGSLDHDANLQARGTAHSAFALVGDAVIDLIKTATERHVSWTVDAADASRYRFESGFELLMLLCPCEVLKEPAVLSQRLTTGSTELHVLVEHIKVC